MKTLAIIGSNGMLGSDLVRYLSKSFKLTGISRDNYNNYKGKSFDILINANGNSKRFWANQNPLEDFFASTVSVIRSIFDFPCEIYIYLSSPDVYENHTGPKYTREDTLINADNLQPYGLHKYLSELIVKKYIKKFLILRLSMVLGTNLKKGPFYDIIQTNSVFITMNSRLQLITTHDVATIIETILGKSLTGEIINVGGIGTFDFTNIRKYFNKEIQISDDAETQIYELNVKKLNSLYPNLKTSEEYLREFMKGL